MIELPKTIRPAQLDEVPKNSSAFERLKQIETAKIIEGYTFQLKNQDNEEHKNIPFDFYSEININNTRLWSLVMALTEMLPDVSALIIGHSDAEPNYGNYIDKSELIKNLETYKTELISDTFMEWGILFHDTESLTEVFVSDSKYVKFWGVNIDYFRKIMSDFNLPQTDDLEFIDEYPKVRVPLRLFGNSVTDTNELINKLKEL